MWRTIKENPWKTAAGSLLTIALSVGGFFFTDSRYMHVDNYNLQKKELESRLVEIKERISKLENPENK